MSLVSSIGRSTGKLTAGDQIEATNQIYLLSTYPNGYGGNRYLNQLAVNLYFLT